ncbi:MAG: secondary thiamine-phosphate synthase enzyme YjbQ [candidate division WOR-3 bacterium]
MFYFEFYLNTKNDEEIIDITDKVEQIVKGSNVKDGLVHVYVPHATAGIILNESADPNIKTDFLNTLNKFIPKRAGYLHDRIDGNAAAHIKSSLVGSSITLPLKDGRLILGTWQSIMFCEFDGPRNNRKIIIQII